MNLGNPAELTVLELASLVLDATGSSSEVVHLEALRDDPARGKPDITQAGELLGWAPEVTLADGLLSTISWFADHLYLGTLPKQGPSGLTVHRKTPARRSRFLSKGDVELRFAPLDTLG